MEPLLLSEGSRHRPSLTDLAVELARRSACFRRSLSQSLLSSLATLVRSMNCYYSDLIEGHDTHPVDIERALQGDYSRDAKKRDLQLEARAHIGVQQWIDDGALRGRTTTAEASEFTRFLLSTCLDQVTFMEGLMRPDALRARILLWAEEEIRLDRLPLKSGAILEALLYRGELPRGEAAGSVGAVKRRDDHARGRFEFYEFFDERDYRSWSAIELAADSRRDSPSLGGVLALLHGALC